jgi:pilus assembly protein CpaB
MRLLIIGLILLAVLAAGGAVLTAKRYLASQSRAHANQVVKPVEEIATYVLVADDKVTIGSTLTRGALRWQRWPNDSVGGTFISANTENDEMLNKLIGTMMRQSVAPGTPITANMVFRRGKAGFLSGIVQEGHRAVTIKVDVVSGVGGFILPGDRVDILVTFDARQLSQNLGGESAAGNRDRAPRNRLSGNVRNGRATSRPINSSNTNTLAQPNMEPAKWSSETILKNVRILAIDQAFEDFEKKAEVVKSMTLEVTPKQAEMLAVGRAMGKLSLALRSWASHETVTTKGTYTVDADISATLRYMSGNSPETRPIPKTKSMAGRRSTQVRVIRGNKQTTRMFPSK